MQKGQRGTFGWAAVPQRIVAQAMGTVVGILVARLVIWHIVDVEPLRHAIDRVWRLTPGVSLPTRAGEAWECMRVLQQGYPFTAIMIKGGEQVEKG